MKEEAVLVEDIIITIFNNNNLEVSNILITFAIVKLKTHHYVKSN